jgi:hypothetical protein
VQPSPTAHRIFFLFYILILIYFLKYETIVRGSAWSYGHSGSDPRSVPRKLSGSPQEALKKPSGSPQEALKNHSGSQERTSILEKKYLLKKIWLKVL